MLKYSPPSCNSSLLLQVFFEKSQEEIDHGLQEYGNRLQRSPKAHWRRSLKLSKAPHAVTPEAVSESYHHQMLEGSKIWKHQWLNKDLALVAATLPAQQLADMSCAVASNHGELAKIHRKMVLIDRVHGLMDDEVWTLEAMPEDYRKLMIRSHLIFEKIFETVFVQILARYRLNSLIDFFENRRLDFEISFEVGRRLLNPNLASNVQENEWVVENFRDQFGPCSVGRLQTRLENYGLA